MKLRLIDDWRKAHKFASVQLGVIASAIAAAAPLAPEVVYGLLKDIPAEYRAYVSPLIFFAVMSLVTLTRITKLQKTNDAAK